MLEQFDLKGRTVMVTGASSGLGRDFAKTLAAHGAQVVAVARRRSLLEQLCDEIAAAGGVAIPVAADVTDIEDIRAAIEEARHAFGGLSILVNNAGVSRESFLTDMSEEDWDVVLDTNLKAVWTMSREVARMMSSLGRGGSIVNIASILAFGTGKALGAYMAAKAGVVQLTRAMAVEWARDAIRVNAIAPGYFPTAMSGDFFTSAKGKEMIARIPMQRVGLIEELRGPLLLLASDASSYMSGSVLTVDGGHMCHPL